jgi:hypothetical protein
MYELYAVKCVRVCVCVCICICVYIYIYRERERYMHIGSSQYRETGRAKEKKNCDSSECRVPRKPYRLP